MVDTKIAENQKPVVAKGRDKSCAFCKAKHEPRWEEYEDMKQYLSARGRILSREITYVCVRHQRQLATAIKRARHLALLPFIAQEV